jgi:hypothetical protein
MSKEFDGDAVKIRTASAERIARVLLRGLPRAGEPEYQAFEDLALVLALIPGLSEWTGPEKKKLAQIIRAKTEADESRYARLIQRHPKLRAAIIKLGESSSAP